MYVNSLDKIVYSYFATVAREDFTYNSTRIKARPLRVSPNIFRGYTCPAQCGGCCLRFSLVYLPTETHPYLLEPFSSTFNGKPVEFFHDPQRSGGHFCANLRCDDGRCNIHGKQPFSCDFELIRVHICAEQNRLSQQLYGRGWQFLRVDGERGALCEMLPATHLYRDDAVRRLRRLAEWAKHCGIQTHLPQIIFWVATGPHTTPLHLTPRA